MASIRYRVKGLCLVLACVLALGSVTPSVNAQTESISPVSSSSDSDSGTSGEEIMFGVLIVVVGILIWLGIKSDWDRRGRAEVQDSIEEYAAAGDLPAEFESGW